MKYPKVNLQDWIKLHDLEITDVPCIKCSSLLEFSIPFTHGGYAGVASEPCKTCGHKQGSLMCVPISDENKEQLKCLFDAIVGRRHDEVIQ